MADIQLVAMIRQAHAWFATNHYDDATNLCLRILKSQKDQHDALMLMANMAWNRKDRQGAIKYAQRMIDARPKDLYGYLRLSQFLNSSGRHKEALSLLQRTRRISPDDPSVLVAIAQTHNLAGDTEAALALLTPQIEQGTANAQAGYLYASMLAEAKRFDEALPVLLQSVPKSVGDPTLMESIYFLLGRVFESLKDIDNAFKAFDAAHRVFPISPEAERVEQICDELLEAFSAKQMARLPRARNQSRLPVFIVCRPRSGSTMVERIIGAHPKVHSAGERVELGELRRDLGLRIGSTRPYPQCVGDLDQEDVDSIADSMLADLQGLAPKASRITDKNVGLWEVLGLIELLFPNAIIIDLRRETIDNCLACYTVPLREQHPYTQSLRTIGLAQRQYERMMDHWYATLKLPMLRVNYEDIVADQETWSRKIIEFCGLEWDDRCLRFHEQGASKSTTASPTLSFSQVRQPIYKTSVARAKKFEKHLGPLYEGLGLPLTPAMIEWQEQQKKTQANAPQG